MKNWQQPKIAIIHDTVLYFGGAERILLALHKIWPQAPIFTSTISWQHLGKFRGRIAKLKITTSWVQRIPFFSDYPFLYRYLLPWVWRFDLTDFDVVISVAHSQMSHLVRVRPGAFHICYCLSPPRHLYGYETDFPWQKFLLVRHLASWGNKFLRWYDRLAAGRVTTFLAISQEVAQRIKQFYGRRSRVVYPPLSLSISANKSKSSGGNYYLVVARLSPMKHIDLVIAACKRLGRKLKVVGIGPEGKRLKQLANENIELLGQVSERQLQRLYAGCRAVICATRDEDLGLVPVEAMSRGRPVIALFSGGFKETIVPGKTGLFFTDLSVPAIVAAIKKFEKSKISARDCTSQARKFSDANFANTMGKVVKAVLTSSSKPW